MYDYTIYCTEEQTKKALELGAPIGVIPDGLIIPTAEQMLGWLEEQYLYITISYTCNFAKDWQADIHHALYTDAYCGVDLIDVNFGSRKNATLAAISSALNYLINHKTK